MKEIYLDAAATTKPKQEVIDAMMPYLTEKWHNPSALYGRASNVHGDIQFARVIVGDFINACPNEIYFTSGGSESNCWAIQGFVNYWKRKGHDVSVITSVIEHKSIMSCVDSLYDVDVHYVKVNSDGVICKKNIEEVLEYIKSENPDNKILVSIQHANNEIGTIQDIKAIAELAHKYGAVFHTDSVQSFGHIPIDVKNLGVDMMSVSGHKVGVPKGSGFLYIKNGVFISPIIYGSQMDGMRGGTENVPYIMGIAKAVELMKNNDKSVRVRAVRDYMVNKLQRIGCKINGSMSNRLPNNISATFRQNVSAESMVYLLDMCGIEVATGSACNSSSINLSHVLKAIGLTDDEVAKTIRITIPDDITMKEIDMVVLEIIRQIKLTSEVLA